MARVWLRQGRVAATVRGSQWPACRSLPNAPTRQNPERSGISARAYARSLARVAKEAEYLRLEIEQEAQDANLSTPPAAQAQQQDAFLRIAVRWRPRPGGGEQLVRERSPFKLVDGAWLYYGKEG